MSTKIYNAYRARPGNVILFCKDIKDEFLERALDSFAEIAARYALELAERIPWMQALDSDAAGRRAIALASLAGYDLTKDSSDRPAVADKKKIAAMRERALMAKAIGYLGEGSVISTAIGLATRSVKKDPEKIEARLAMFRDPGDFSRVMMIAFGQDFADFMENIPDGLLEKYEVEDYHYQNQTDKPDGVSESEWDERERYWDEVMPSGIPSTDGMVVDICDVGTLTNRYLREIYGAHDKDNALVKAVAEKIVRSCPEKRLIEYANDRAGAEYMRNQVSTSDAVRFLSDLRKEGTYAHKLSQDMRREIEPLMKDFGDIAKTTAMLLEPAPIDTERNGPEGAAGPETNCADGTYDCDGCAIDGE